MRAHVSAERVGSRVSEPPPAQPGARSGPTLSPVGPGARILRTPCHRLAARACESRNRAGQTLRQALTAKLAVTFLPCIGGPPLRPDGLRSTLREVRRWSMQESWRVK